MHAIGPPGIDRFPIADRSRRRIGRVRPDLPFEVRRRNCRLGPGLASLFAYPARRIGRIGLGLPRTSNDSCRGKIPAHGLWSRLVLIVAHTEDLVRGAIRVTYYK